MTAPSWPDRGPQLAVSFSGGGFRASLAGLGMTRALADLGLLGNVRFTSSVSGGSWANALLALNWDDLKERNFETEAVDQLLVEPFVKRITTTSLSRRMTLRLWKVIGPRTRTDLLADAFDDWFGHGRTLGDLSADARFIFNATNLTTGRRFSFDQQHLGERGADSLPSEKMRVADALAASAALPGALSAQRLPRSVARPPRPSRPLLVDGAVYNLGIEPLRDLDTHPLMVVLDAGAPLHRLNRDLGIIDTLRRSSAVGMNQLTAVRERWFVASLRAWEHWADQNPDQHRSYMADQAHSDAAIASWRLRQANAETKPGETPPPMPPAGAHWGVIFRLDTSMDAKPSHAAYHESRHTRYEDDPQAPEVPPWRDGTFSAAAFRAHTANVPMSAGRFEDYICRDLIYRGWWLTRETIRTFHPEVLATIPAWSEWYAPAITKTG